MKSSIRRLEKNKKVIEELKKTYKNFVDLSFYEKQDEFLEGTGSLIVDNLNKKFFCST